MKKNITLALILSILLGIAFLSEEVLKKQKILENKKHSKVIKDVNDILEIKTKNFHFLKQNGVWTDKDDKWPLDQELMREVLSIYDSIQFQGSVKKDDISEYFNETKIEISFKYNNSYETYYFGNFSKVTGAFYVTKKSNPREVKISYDRSHLAVPYQNERDLYIKKYNRILNLVKSSKYNYYSQNLLEYLGIGLSNITNVRVDNRINRWFEVNLKENHTFPKIPGKLEYSQPGKIILNGLNGFKLKNIITEGQNVLTNLSSTVEIKGIKNYELKLYSALNGRFGKFLRINGINRIYELEIPKYSIFNLNVQDFWIKKIYYGLDFSKMEEINFSLSFNGLKYYNFYVDDLETFQIRSKDKTVKFISKAHMNFLFNLIFNLTDFKEAKFVEVIYTDKVKKADLIVKLLNKTLAILITDTEIIVTDLSDKLKYYFRYNQQQIKKGFFDKIFTVKQK